MTFREALQIQIKALQDIYDNAEGLRDVASTQKEKQPFNNLRGTLPAVWSQLQDLDNSLSDSIANYQCKGNYCITVTPENI